MLNELLGTPSEKDLDELLELVRGDGRQNSINQQTDTPAGPCVAP